MAIIKPVLAYCLNSVWDDFVARFKLPRVKNKTKV